MKKRSQTELRILEKLRFELCRGIMRPLFVFIEYRLFKDSEEEGSALALQLPRFLAPLSMLVHIIESHALTLLKLPCYLTKFDGEITGVFAYQEYNESLLVASLGVRKTYRRLGIGSLILKQIEKAARKMRKKYLEVDVLIKNIPAKRLYERTGFKFLRRSKKRSISRGTKVLV